MATAIDRGFDAVCEQSRNSASWMMVLLAVGATSLAAYVGMVRPAQSHLAELEQQCANLAAAVEQLNLSHASAKEGSSLVTLLSQQERQLAGAERALAQLESLRRRVVDEANQTALATAALDRLAVAQDEMAGLGMSLQRKATGLGQSLQTASDSLDIAGHSLNGAFANLTDVQQFSRDIHTTSDVVGEALNGAADKLAAMESVSRSVHATSDFAREAHQSLAAIDRFHGDVLTAVQRLAEASPVVDAVAKLCDEIALAQSGVSDAADVSREMIDLQRQIVDQRAEVDAANGSLREFERLCDRIDARGNQVAASHRQLSELLKLKDNLIARTDDVVDALATLEHLSSLTDGLLQANSTVSQIQHMVVDVMLMQPAVDRAVQALRPVVEFTRLSRRVPSTPKFSSRPAQPESTPTRIEEKDDLDVASALLEKK